MPVYLSPGVYVNILDKSLYIPALSTTIVGMVGMASKGPISKAGNPVEPTYISNLTDFVEAFGQPNPNYFGPYAALQFLNYGRQLYYQRVAGPSAAKATGTLYEATTTASVTAGVAGPYTIVSGNNNVLRVKLNGAGSFTVVTLTKGVQTAAAIAAEITAALSGSFTCTVNSQGSITLASTTLGSGSHVIIDSVANGSTANTPLGFPSGGVTSDGSAATAGYSQGVGVNEPYNIAASSNDHITVAIDGTLYDITLTAGATRSAADICTDINAVILTAGTAAPAVVSGNTVVKITSATTGSTSTVQFTPFTTTALATLGLNTNLHFGTEQTAGSVTGSTPGLYAIGANNSLKLRINGGTLRTVPLPSGVQSTGTLINAINTIIGVDGYNEGIATVTSDSKIKISTLVPGAAGSIQIDSSGSGQYAFNFSTALVTGTGSSSTATIAVSALTEGTHGNALKIVASAGLAPSTFRLSVYDGDQLVEVWDNLSKTPLATNYVETVINEVSTWITVTDDTGTAVFPAYTVTTLSGGDDGLDDIADADYIGIVSGQGKTGLQSFRNGEEQDLNLLLCPGVSSAAVINEMLLICSIRGDAMAIIDPPFGLSTQQVTDWHNGYGAYSDHQAFNSMYGALYWPWLQIYDAVNRQKVWVPPSGLLAGVYAFTDYTTETWFAPAGLNRGHLIQPLKVEHSPDLGERDLLYGNQNAVNPIVNFRRDGITVWGQRSLQRKPSALDRVNVVRLVLYLSKTIAAAARYFVFEPNDEITWAEIRNVIEPYLESVKQRRGLVEYRVICDLASNPPASRDRNEMNVYVALKPVKAAEFINLTFVVTAQGTKLADLQF